MLPVPSRKVGGLILIGDLSEAPAPSGSTVVDARVRSADQRADLDLRSPE